MPSNLIIRSSRDLARLRDDVYRAEREARGARHLAARRNYNFIRNSLRLRGGDGRGTYNSVQVKCVKCAEFHAFRTPHLNKTTYAHALSTLKEYKTWFQLVSVDALKPYTCLLYTVRIKYNSYSSGPLQSAEAIQNEIRQLQSTSPPPMQVVVTGELEPFHMDAFDYITSKVHGQVNTSGQISEPEHVVRLFGLWKDALEAYEGKGWSVMDNKIENLLVNVRKLEHAEDRAVVITDHGETQLSASETFPLSSFSIGCATCTNAKRLVTEKRTNPQLLAKGGCMILSPWLGYLCGCYLATYRQPLYPNCALMAGCNDWNIFYDDDAWDNWRGNGQHSFADLPVEEQHQRLYDFCTEPTEESIEYTIQHPQHPKNGQTMKYNSIHPDMTQVLLEAKELVLSKLVHHTGYEPPTDAAEAAASGGSGGAAASASGSAASAGAAAAGTPVPSGTPSSNIPQGMPRSPLRKEPEQQQQEAKKRKHGPSATPNPMDPRNWGNKRQAGSFSGVTSSHGGEA